MSGSWPRGRQECKVIFIRFLSMLLSVALLTGNVVIVPVKPASPLKPVTATLAGDHRAAHHQMDASGAIAAPAAAHAATTPVPSRMLRCPQPSLDCPCADCQDYIAAHFVTLTVWNDSPFVAYRSESPQPWFPANHVHPSDPPAIPPPNRV